MIGKTVSHYEIRSKLGAGGMGVVYKAYDTALKRFVALKFLPPDLTRDDGARRRFIHEAQAAEHYRDFIELWKDCAPELRPVLLDAQSRLSSLTQ